MGKYDFPQYGLAFVSGKIIYDHRPVGVMVRKEPNPDLPSCGWAFLEGGETPAYLKKEENLWLHSVGKVLEIDPSIEPLLEAPVGSRFERNDDGEFVEVIETPEPTTPRT